MHFNHFNQKWQKKINLFFLIFAEQHSLHPRAKVAVLVNIYKTVVKNEIKERNYYNYCSSSFIRENRRATTSSEIVLLSQRYIRMKII